MQQNLLKTLYNNQRKSVSIATRFNSKKSFPNLAIFTNRKDSTIE